MQLPSDIVHHIIDALTLTSIRSDESSSLLTSALCSASWISKDFASITRKHLFRDTLISTQARCCSLLALLQKNPALQTVITHIILEPLPDIERRRLSGSRSDPGYGGIVSASTSELVNKLGCLNSITFRRMRLNPELVENIIMQILRPRKQDITHLNITSCDSISLHDLDRLITYLPALEALCLEGSKSWVIVSDERDQVNIANEYTKPHPLRRMKLRLGGNYPAEDSLPLWFTSRAYLSSLEELDLAYDSLELFASAWDAIVGGSSTLTHLTLQPSDTHGYRDFSIHLETLAVPALTSLRITNFYGDQPSMRWVAMVLSSIAPCTTMRSLHIDKVRHRLSHRYETTIALWGAIDEVSTRTFPNLQHAHVEIEWEIYEGDKSPDEDAIRLAMPGLDRMGILELQLSVTTDDGECDLTMGLFD
jgi:hypothetical protein